MVTLRDIAAGEKLARFECYEYSLYEEPPTSSFPTSKSPWKECCASCLRWGEELPEHCSLCKEPYCSSACRNRAKIHGHRFCCAPLSRLSAVSTKKYTLWERATARFLLRAFARHRAAGTSALPDALKCGEWHTEPRFSHMLEQCPDLNACETRHATEKRAVQLARLQKASLVDERQALELLRREPCNSFHLFDPDEIVRGALNYPQASIFNHSCMPNCAALATGNAMEFEALTDICAGEELTYCYLRSFAGGSDETIDPWGFSCDCMRCTGAATAEAVAAFDATWRCVCGKIVVARKAEIARSLGICQCHAHNHVQ